MDYARHSEARAAVNAAPEAVFDFLDDQEALGAHMTKRSAMMAGGRMSYEFDDARGRAVGAVIRMRGEVLGLSLRVEEIVTERAPPRRKVVETRGSQQMLVIDAYRLGFEIEPANEQCSVRVFIDYNLPPGPLGALTAFAADAYARWCVASMVGAAAARFGLISRNGEDREEPNA